MGRRRTVLATLAVLLATATAPPAGAATERRSEQFVASDGVALQTTLTGQAPLVARPTIVEFSPYGRDSGTFDAGPAYNHLLVQLRGTGDSHGRFDVLGPRTQADLAETLGWACKQPWSDGRFGLAGFSASAIAVYNALHLELPCVRAAVLKSGTHELYRDLLVPGGVQNIVPGAVVLTGIGGIALAQGLQRDPATAADALLGLLRSGTEVLQHPTLDGWWRERGYRGNGNPGLPVLAVAGFSDVESRGAFEGYRALRDDGAHLLVIGAHDARPAGTDGGLGEMRAWMDRNVRGIDNGVDDHPRVQLWLSDGDRASYAKGRFVRRDATDWPVPGTRWRSLYLDATRSGSATSLNDGTLADRPAQRPVRQRYPGLVSVPTMTDVPNAAIIDAAGASALTDALPALGDMRLAEPLGLSYTTPPLARDLVAAGPAALELDLATTAPRAAIWAVVSDVGPSGIPKPLGVGRLSTDFPDTDPARDRTDADGAVVQPYGRYDRPRPAAPGTSRRYRVELWPLGNRFRAGHRLRLHLVGTSLASVPDLPGLNTVTIGGAGGSRLLVPELPDPAPASPAPACRSRRTVTVTVPRGDRRRLRSATVTVGDRVVARLTRTRPRARVDLRGRPRGTVRVRLHLRLADGRRVVRTQRYRLCAPRRG